MARSLPFAVAALALVCVGRAHADPLPITPPLAQSKPLDFVAQLFGGPPQPPTLPQTQVQPQPQAPLAPLPTATSAPISLLPPAAAPVAEHRPSPRRIAATAAVPMPHLRPAYAPVIAALPKTTPPTVASVVSLGIDSKITGSIELLAPPPDPATTPVPPPFEPPPVAQKPAPSTHVALIPESDGLLGDPSEYLLARSDGLAPNTPEPAGIEAPNASQFRLRDTAGGAAPSPLSGSQPFELVRTLQSLQDRMAQGDIPAVNAQHALRSEIDRVFAAAAPAVWQDRRNAAAAVTYVLSGGPPEVLARLAALDPKPAIDEKLIKGVLAYAGGHPDEAAPLLADVDPTSLPASMAGQVAIAQSALVVRTDPAKAMKLLAVARLLAPGTLVEEAAIRRQLLVADQQKDEETVQSLARQYLDRFRHSVYAGNFRARFATALSHMTAIDREDQFPRLDDMLAMVEPDARCELYLTVALASRDEQPRDRREACGRKSERAGARRLRSGGARAPLSCRGARRDAGAGRQGHERSGGPRPPPAVRLRSGVLRGRRFHGSWRRLGHAARRDQVRDRRASRRGRGAGRRAGDETGARCARSHQDPDRVRRMNISPNLPTDGGSERVGARQQPTTTGEPVSVKGVFRALFEQMGLLSDARGGQASERPASDGGGTDGDATPHRQVPMRRLVGRARRIPFPWVTTRTLTL